MRTLDHLKDKSKLIFDTISSLDVTDAKFNFAPPEIYKVYCTDKGQKNSFYEQKFRTYLIKEQGIVNTNILKNQDVIKLFSKNEILNVFYFEVWGDVIEHKDPPGTHLGYSQNQYNTVLMPISIPSKDKAIFDTFYNKKSVSLKEGDFICWDVCNVPHSWKFDYKKVNKLFKLLHIDYIE